MSLRWFLWILGMGICLSAWGQEAQRPEPTPVALPSTRTLARSYPVITVEGVCGPGAAKAGPCRTVITRAEFEDLVEAVNPRMTKTERRQLAQNYGRMLALEGEAWRRGIEKKPQMQALLRYVRASALSGGAFRQVLREAGENSEAAQGEYFKANRAMYERFTLERLFIPAMKQQAQAKSLEQAASDDGIDPSLEEMKALAEKMRARAAAGEDMAALEKEIAQQSGLPSVPQVEMNDVLRGTLPKEHNQAFELPAGAASALIADGTGYYVYKVVARKTPDFESVRQQVAVEMENQRAAAAMKNIEHVAINDTYFEKYDPPPAKANEMEVDDD